MRSSRSRQFAAVSVIVLAAAACGTDDDRARSTSTTPPSTVVPSTVASPPSVSPTSTTLVERGWVDGEPNWSGSAAPEFLGADDAVAWSEDSATRYAAETDGASGGAGAVDDMVEPSTSDATAPLRAGSVDDNADFAGFAAYLERIAGLGIVTRDYDPTGRIVITVTGDDGRPVAGVPIGITDVDGVPVAELRTTADGTARFHPRLHGSSAESFVATVAETKTALRAGFDSRIEIAAPDRGAIQLDVLFLLDATGSMSDEIDRLKASIDAVAARIDGFDPSPDSRFAMTVYRDEGDAFVTSTYDFTADVEAFRAALADVVADGGGDYPEALDEGLADALGTPTWRDPAATVQLVFLVADAPPQIARQVDTPYTDSIRDAVGRGIKVFPIASSESDDQAEAVFRQLAQSTGARFVFLSYGAGGAATGGATDIDRTDYEELALDDLVVRLVTEELAALEGATPPPLPPPPTTTPDGQ